MSTQALPTHENQRFHFNWKWLLYALPLLPFFFSMWFAIAKPILVLPRMQVAPGFILTHQDGETITSEDMRGAIYLVNFTYTHCEAPTCDQTTDGMARLYDRLGEAELDGVPLNLVTMSFDPARDDTAALSEFAAHYNAPAPTSARFPWYFGTNSSETALKAIIGGGYGIWYEIDEDSRVSATEYDFNFRPRYLLIDGWGVVRAQYSTTDLDIDLVLRDINLVVQEISRSDGNLKLAYEAAHLFRCYP